LIRAAAQDAPPLRTGFMVEGTVTDIESPGRIVVDITLPGQVWVHP
jgi:hypothetical protein